MTNYKNTYKFKHIVEAQQFDRDTLLNWIFPLADKMRDIAQQKNCAYLKGKRMVSWFEEPSTRTAASFALAISLLGGEVSYSTENAGKFSSRAKGESIEDTIDILNGYFPDVIVGRFAEAGDALKAAKISPVPIFNAGDGNNQHPTQSLLDLYTIYKDFGRIEGLRIGLIGDLLNGRTVKSLSYLAGKFDKIKLYYISPESLRITDNIKEHLDKHQIHYVELDDLRQIAYALDVFYLTRIQYERGSLLAEAELEPGRFSISQKILDDMREKAIIMHPMPRGIEIPRWVDTHPGARYFQQAQNGLYIRMALLLMAISPDIVIYLLKK